MVSVVGTDAGSVVGGVCVVGQKSTNKLSNLSCFLPYSMYVHGFRNAVDHDVHFFGPMVMAFGDKFQHSKGSTKRLGNGQLFGTVGQKQF